MKIAFIHNDKKIGTGAHFINDLMAARLREAGVKVKNFYPKNPLLDTPQHLKGLSNILFFYSLLENKDEILKYDLIQGTTYTPLALLPFPIPVVSHFGSTSWGFLQSVPLARDMDIALRTIWVALKKDGAMHELNLRTQRPLRDVAEIERLVAMRAEAVIATSNIVRDDLLAAGVPRDRIHVVPNAIEDYWFQNPPSTVSEQPALFFLGRLGADAFTLKLKGFDRLIDFYQSFPDTTKYTIGMTTNKKLAEWCNKKIPNHRFLANVSKETIPGILHPHAGSILLITSRYEGFSLSLIEGMSQGLIPVTYSVGIAPEIIKNGENGFLVHSQAEGKKRIAYIMSLSKKERAVLAHAAHLSSQYFASKVIAQRLLNVYETTLKKYQNTGTFRSHLRRWMKPRS